ncbi:MAG TPA: FAD-dependent oxidoreductase [Candidatus Acidoferrales bacterium]|nr:FAD-dependent oxidoreductase [Candidatus Acidoferrales bacterium]
MSTERTASGMWKPGTHLLDELRRPQSATDGYRGEKQHVVILGAGPAGVGAAFQLQRTGLAQATVLEQGNTVGGMAGSFNLDGVFCDHGSHRLHPAVDPAVLRDLEALLGEDLRLRVRHGRIRLQGRWIHFPLKPVDLLLRLPKKFAFGVTGDLLRKVLPRGTEGPETFASVLERGLGRTICQEFYFPYARKLWGVAPEELAPTTAKRRVSGSSIGKMIGKILNQVPGLKPPRAGKFFYPRRGYGHFSECLAEAAQKAGAEIVFGARVTSLERDGNRVTAVRYVKDGVEHVLPTKHVWSTLPVTLLMRLMQPPAPAEVIEAANGLCYRGMVLIYLVLEQDRFSGFDAYYFPEESMPVSRMSEPKNFFGNVEPRGTTVLCAELPCDPGEPNWELSDAELGKKLCAWLEASGLPVRAPIRRVVTRRVRQAYPVYRQGYEEPLQRMDAWLQGLEGLLHYGRQALFAHDNTHHALYMAYAAVDCFAPDGTFDEDRWAMYRKVFETHVVED